MRVSRLPYMAERLSMNSYGLVKKIYEEIAEIFESDIVTEIKIASTLRKGFKVTIPSEKSRVSFEIDKMIVGNAYRFKLNGNEFRLFEDFVEVDSYNGISVEDFIGQLNVIQDFLLNFQKTQKTLLKKKKQFEQNLLVVEV